MANVSFPHSDNVNYVFKVKFYCLADSFSSQKGQEDFTLFYCITKKGVSVFEILTKICF